MATKKSKGDGVRYAALLRGVSPTNCKMAELAASFEAAGFTDVRTVLSSGNVLFSAPKASEAQLARRAEAAMTAHMGRSFATIVRSVDSLRALLDSAPFAKFRVPPSDKRVVSFLMAPAKTKLALPIEEDGARILRVSEGEAFTAYTRRPGDPVFMRLIERTFGKSVTTRTWETIEKLAK